MPNVFVLQHVHSAEDDVEDVKLISVYSSREKAESAVMRLRQAPGFLDTPDGFHVDEYDLDRDHWVEGYVTFANAKLATPRYRA